MRVAGVIFCAQSYQGVGPDFSLAHHKLKAHLVQMNKLLPEDQQQHLNYHDLNYLRKWWNDFLTKGSVADAPKPGAPTLISREQALKASGIVKEGWLQKETVKGKVVEHRVYYTSIAEAISRNQYLQELVSDLGLEPEQLLQAMHKHDPSLVRRKIFFKHSFTMAELDERVKDCADLQVKTGLMTTNTIYIDESSIVINKYTESDVYVWCDKHDLNFSDVCHRKLPKEGSVTVRFIVAVSPHPKFADKGGLVYMDFTTGTTDISRRHNKMQDGSQLAGDQIYLVSTLHSVDDAVAITVSNTVAVRNQL